MLRRWWWWWYDDDTVLSLLLLLLLLFKSEILQCCLLYVEPGKKRWDKSLKKKSLNVCASLSIKFSHELWFHAIRAEGRITWAEEFGFTVGYLDYISEELSRNSALNVLLNPMKLQIWHRVLMYFEESVHVCPCE